MKKTGFAFTLLALVLMNCDRVQAQKPGPQSTLVTTTPDLTKLNIEKKTASVIQRQRKLSGIAGRESRRPEHLRELGNRDLTQTQIGSGDANSLGLSDRVGER